MEHIIDPHSLIGFSGNVTPLEDDPFSEEFYGFCIGVRNGFLQVQDQEEDVFEIEVSQFTPYHDFEKL